MRNILKNFVFGKGCGCGKKPMQPIIPSNPKQLHHKFSTAHKINTKKQNP